MNINVEQDGTLVVRELETDRASTFVATILDAAQRLHAVIQRLELRPLRNKLVARIVMTPGDERDGQRDQLAIVDALLSSLAAPVPA